jgi:peptidoglycan/LPS O-acetylase OafA/YrhL
VGIGVLWAIATQPRILNHWLAVWLGAISYSLYIWHMPFMNPRAGIAFPLNFVLAFMAATVSYYLLEQPVLGLRNLRNNQPIEKQATIG